MASGDSPDGGTEPVAPDPLGDQLPLLRGLTASRFSRRRLLQRGGGALAGASLASVLAACGIAGTQDTGWKAGFDWDAWWKEQRATGKLVFANWPLYIDRVKDGSPTIDMFSERTGTDVGYRPIIQDNASFFAQISPVLQAEQSIGYDLVVITNGWELTQLIANRWLIPLDHSRLPNFRKHAGAAIKDPAYDPGNQYTLTWQSGITGIGYDRSKTGRDITSVKDLFDPKFAGKVGMMSDNTELGSCGMLALGIDPVSSTPEDWRKAAELLQKQRDDGIVRQYYDQSYIKALQDGDTWISLAWSGDVFQSQVSGYPNLEFVVPEEGGMFWHDNLMIPLHAANPVDALMWMDFSYRPEIQALIEDWVNYICPVPASKRIIAGKLADPTVANSPLIFPDAKTISRLRDYYDFTGIDDHEEWTKIFDPIIQS